MAIGLMLHPFTESSIPENALNFFRSLVFARIIFAIGGASSVTMLTAFTANVASTHSPTKISSYLGICSGLGAMFSAFFLNRLPPLLDGIMTKRFSLMCPFALMTLILLIAAVLIFLTFPKRSETFSKECLDPQKRDVYLALISITSGAIARINTVTPHLFMPLWISNYCHAYFPEQNTFSSSKKASSTLLGICQLSALLCAPIFGIFGKRINAGNLMFLMSAIGALSYLSLYLLQNPTCIAGYCLMVVIGIVEIASVILSLSLYISSFGSSRGKRSGLYSFFGSLGIILISNLGGYLSDSFDRHTPFIAVGYLNLIFSCLGICTNNRNHLTEVMK